MAEGLESLRGVSATLESGARVVVVPMPRVHRTVLEANLRTGSRFESPALNGISHFLEHMLFRGTPRHPSAHQLILAVESLGGSLNAATSVDHGSLSLEAPPATFDALIPIFAEAYQNPVLSGIDVEKGIVREEILESLDDAGRQIDPDNLVREACFGSHPLGMPITGTLAHLDAFDRTRLLAHHRAHYTAPGTVLTVAGPVDPAGTIEALTAAFRSLPPGELPQTGAPPPPQTAPCWHYVRHAASSQTALRVVFRAPSESAPDEPAADLVSRLLDDGMATRLYHRICDARGLCYDVSATYEAYSDDGILEIAMEAAHEATPKVLREVFDVVRELRDRGPTEQELAKAKARYGWQLDEMLDDPASAAEFLGVETLTGLQRTPDQRLAEIQSVSPTALMEVAAQIFQRRRLTVVAVGALPRAVEQALARLVASF